MRLLGFELRFVPPEAVAAALARAGPGSTWACGICTLINGPREERCEACGAPKGATAMLEARGSADDAWGDDGEGTRADPKGKGKGKKVPKFERLRLTGGDGSATQVRATPY
jgi:hypothetical protein